MLKGEATEENYPQFLQIKEYAKTVKTLAEEYGLYFLPLQEKLDEAARKFGAEKYLYDGVHPTVAGAGLIAEAWVKLFREYIERS